MAPSTKTILVTGANGQLGYHCRVRLQYHYGFNVIALDRAAFNSDQHLGDAVQKADVVLHIAGVNRGTDEEIEAGNINLASRLIKACEKSDKNAHIIYTSTIQIDRGNVYGNAKRKAGELISGYCERVGSPYLEVVLPNLFGEFSRPNYNNFTGTFCDQIVRGLAPSVQSNAQVPLLHYRDAADAIANAIEQGTVGVLAPAGQASGVKDIADLLEGQFKDYKDGVIPDVRSSFELDIFNMLRNFMFPKQFPVQLTRHADARGSFFECIRARNSGQTSFSTTVPGITRGDHFHFRKVERFLVLSGKARISLRKVFDDKVIHFDVNGEEPCFIDMPTLHTHNITNIGDSELLTLFWTHDFFDPANTDTYVEPV